MESKVFSSSRRERVTSSSSCMFSMMRRQLRAELVGAIEQVELAADLDADALDDDRAERAPVAAQRHRQVWSGTSRSAPA